MGINRGKQFENKLKEQFEKLPNTLCLRLYDITMGYSNINNPCDFIVYRTGTLNLFELKAIHGNCLNFKSHIKENQFESLVKYNQIPGVNAGIICWFVDLDRTVFIDGTNLSWFRDTHHLKSFNINNRIKDLDYIEIQGKKKRVFFEYDLEKFLEEISYEC